MQTSIKFKTNSMKAKNAFKKGQKVKIKVGNNRVKKGSIYKVKSFYFFPLWDSYLYTLVDENGNEVRQGALIKSWFEDYLKKA